MSVRRSLLVLTIIIFALPLAIFAARANRPASSVGTDVQTYTIALGDVDSTISAIGAVEAERSVRLSFSTPGRVVDLLVAAGDVVSAGDVLARQADNAQRIAHDQADLVLQLAQLQRDKLLAGADESQIAIGEANVASAQGAASSIQNVVSDNDLRAAQLSYDQAQQAVADAQHARAFGSGSQEQIDLLDARVGEASFNAEIARLNLESLQTGSTAQIGAAYARVAQAQSELDRVRAGASNAEIERADAAIAQAQIAVDRAQAMLDRAVLTAPFDGVVTGINAEVGSLVAPGVTVVEIADVTPLHLVVQVDEIDVRQIAVGMPARVRLDALPDSEFSAMIDTIALVPINDNGVVSYDVTVRLDDSDARERVGMTADAAIIVDSKSDVGVVPNQYIRLDRQRGQAYVNLVGVNKMLSEVPVILGLQGQDRSEVTSGLRAGDVIGIDLAADSISLFGS